MEKVKAVLRALIGYSGSSENPQVMSLRFMGVITAVLSQFSPLISLVVAHFGGQSLNVEAVTAFIEPLILTGACVMWLVGAVRAVLNMPKVAGFLRK